MARKYNSNTSCGHMYFADFFCNDKGVPRQEIILVVSGRGTES